MILDSSKSLKIGADPVLVDLRHRIRRSNGLLESSKNTKVDRKTLNKAGRRIKTLNPALSPEERYRAQLTERAGSLTITLRVGGRPSDRLSKPILY